MKALALAVICCAGVAHADCDPAPLRAELVREATRMDHWRYGWSIAYGIATVGQVAPVLAKWNPFGAYDRNYRDANLVGAAESTLGALGSLLAPAIAVPEPQADACADLAALQAARLEAGKAERLTFIESHVGNLVVNLAGSAVLVERSSWSAGIIAFVIGYPIGVLNTYTMPRESWHVIAAPVPQGGVALVTGTF